MSIEPLVREAVDFIRGENAWTPRQAVLNRTSAIDLQELNHALEIGCERRDIKQRVGALGYEYAHYELPEPEQAGRPDWKPAAARHASPPPVTQTPLLDAPRASVGRVEPERPRPAAKLQPAAAVSPAPEAPSITRAAAPKPLPITGPAAPKAPSITTAELAAPQPAPTAPIPPAQPEEPSMPPEISKTVVPGEKIAECVLELIYDGPKTAAEISAAIGRNLKDGVAAYYLGKLAKAGQIKKVSNKRGAPYRLCEAKGAKAAPAKAAAKSKPGTRKAAPRAEAPPPAGSLRCAIWNDGSLSLKGRELEGVLEVDEVRELFQYLDRTLPDEIKQAA